MPMHSQIISLPLFILFPLASIWLILHPYSVALVTSALASSAVKPVPVFVLFLGLLVVSVASS